jgi:hypothetical protein
LYEFTFGARKIASSFRHAIWPASQPLNSAVSPSNALSEPRQSDEWMWHDEPIHVWSGLAMKVIEQPFRCAISFAPFL